MNKRFTLPELAEIILACSDLPKLSAQIQQLAAATAAHDDKIRELRELQSNLDASAKALEQKEATFIQREAEIAARISAANEREAAVVAGELRLTERERHLDNKAQELEARDKELERKSRVFKSAVQGVLVDEARN